jgi:hypothetical protein
MTTTTPAILRRSLTVLAVGAASLALAGCSLLGNITGGNTDTGDGGTGTDVDVFTIAVGDCLNDGGVDGEVTTVPTVDCAEPHDSEAYASILMPDGEFPGDSVVEDFAVEECTAAFDSFVGLAYADSTLSFSYYYPTAESWTNGDREILCLLVDPAGQVTGSLKGAAR